MTHYNSILLRGLLSGKRILVLFYMLAMFIPSYSYDFTVDGIYYRKSGNNQVAVTYKNSSYDCYSGIVNIPESVVYNGVSFNVASIGNRAFYNCNGLTSVTIPNSVTSIEDYAFKGCSGLTSVTIPNSVTSVGYEAFYNCSSLTSVTIPNSVTSFHEKVFYNCYGLTSVTIGNSVTSIGYEAFYNCSGLTSVTIPNSVTSIGYEAFKYCSGLTSVTIGNSVKSIGDKAFQYCSGLSSVTIGNSVTSIDDKAFQYCSSLTSVTILCPKVGSWFSGMTSIKEVVIGDGVVSIDDKAFSGCSGLTSVTIGNSVTSIGSSAFLGCSGLTSVTIGNSVTSIGRSAFSGCSGLTSVTIPNGVTSIGSSAFYGCSGLTSVTIGNSVTSIGDYAFRNCSSLTSVTIPNSVTSIGREAFSGCNSLTSVTIGNSVESIGYEAFYNCSGLTSVTILCPKVDSWFSGMKSIKEVVIGDGVESIGSSAFSGCSNIYIKILAVVPPLLENEIDANIIEVPIGSGCRYAAADYWNKIDTIVAIQGNRRYYPVPLLSYGERIVSVNGVMELGIEMEEGKMIEVLPINDLTQYGLIMKDSLNISDVVLRKGKFVFNTSSNHKRNLIETHAYPTQVIQLSESGTLLNQIGTDNINNVYSLKVSGNLNGTDILTIRKMTNLKMLDMEDANIVNGGVSYYQNYVTSQNAIGDYFFKEKDNLVSIKLPLTITEIKDNAFDGCKKMAAITIFSNVTYIGSSAFSGCSSLTSVNIHDIAAWCKIYFDSNPLEYAHHLCLNGEEIKDLVIPNSVTSIGSSAFKYCSGLTSVTIPNGVTSIGYEAFKYCNGLTLVTIGNSVTSIGEGAFEGCSGLTSMNIGNSVTYIGRNAFSDCSGLTSVNIHDIAAWCKIFFDSNPLWYAHHLYMNGEEIKDLVIPNNVTYIGGFAFSSCSGLTSVTIGESVKSIGSYAFSNCSGLTSITIPNSVTSIGEGAFRGCSGLTSITIPNSVTSIGEGAFRGCSGLTSITIPNSVTSIGYYAFEGCSGLTSVTIFCPNVGSWFSGNTSIKEVVIGDGVTSIGGSAFKGCSGLTSVISLNTTPPQISKSTFSDETYKSATLKVPVGCKNIYWLHPYWENFTKIEEIEGNEDISEKQALALKSYQDAMSVWDSYVYYYKGEGQTFYQTTYKKRSDNIKYINDIFADIERLKKQISDSSMSDDEKASYNKTLDEIEDAVYYLDKDNWSGCYIYFNESVEKYYNPFSDYYSRLEQYKKRIDAATTNEELDAIIAEIDADAAEMTYYMDSIISDYNEMVRISQRLTEIGEELSKYQTKLKEIAKDIEASISGIEQVLLSDSDVIVVSLRGERMKMKSSQIRALPKGIYIVNGRKFVVK